MGDNLVPIPPEVAQSGAYILPEDSKAADTLLSTIQNNQQVDAQNQANKLKQAQALAASYKDNTFKAKNGLLFNNELLGLQQKHIQQGMDYAKQGWDVYNPDPSDPEQMNASSQYMQDRGKLENMQAVRDQLQTHLLEQDKKVSESTPGKFDSDSVQALHDFYTKNTLGGIVNNGLQAPYVQEAFDPESVLSKAEPSMSGVTEFNKGNHKITQNTFLPRQTMQNGESAFLNTPGGANWLTKKTGLTPQQYHALPSGNLQDIQDYNDQYFRNNPQGMQQVASMGINSYSDPKYQQLLQAKSAQDLQGKQIYDNVLGQYADRALTKAHPEYRNVLDYTQQREAREEQERAENRQKFIEGQTAKQGGQIVYGNQESAVPVIQNNEATDKNHVIPEQGSTLFSQTFPQTKLMVTPSNYVDLASGHSVKNSNPIELNAGTVKMEPVFKGLNKGDDPRNGAIMSKKQMEDMIGGTSKDGDISNISFQPMVYGQVPVKDKVGVTSYKDVAVPYQSVHGNTKVKSANFDKEIGNFNNLAKQLNTPIIKDQTTGQMRLPTPQEKMEILKQAYNVQ